MIVNSEFDPYPLLVQPLDVLFLAARVPFGDEQLCSVEHVALAADGKTLQNDEDFLNLEVYGLPESSGSSDRRLKRRQTRWWQGHYLLSEIGSPTRVWNLSGRVAALDPERAELSLNEFAFRHGSTKFLASSQFLVSAEFGATFESNCLGFVCSVLKSLNFFLLGDNYPEYQSRYRVPPPTRDFPSPGHLARALDLLDPSMLPYTPATSSEARLYAAAAVTLAARVRS